MCVIKRIIHYLKFTQKIKAYSIYNVLNLNIYRANFYLYKKNIKNAFHYL